MMKIKAAIFDLDGTLCDTIPAITEGINRTRKIYGLPTHSESDVLTYINYGSRELVRRAFPEFPEEKVGEILSEYTSQYGQCYMITKEAYPGIKEILASLKEKGIKLAVLTNKMDGITQEIIYDVFGRDTFLYIVAQGMFPPKPDPQSANYLLEKLSVSREETVLIGDSHIDIRTAKNAGLHSIGVSWGYRTPEILISEGAERIAETAYDIPAIIDEF